MGIHNHCVANVHANHFDIRSDTVAGIHGTYELFFETAFELLLI